MDTINYEKVGHVLHITLDRPKSHNAMNAQMIEELTEAFKKFTTDPTIRVVLLKGNGSSFCAGADLHWMQDSVEFSKQQNLEDAMKLYDMLNAIKTCQVPVVTRVHGNIMGGALGIVAASDIVFAEVGAIFCFSEVKLGLVPAMISPFVKRKMHPASMHKLLLTAQRFDADEALRVGLVNAKGRELEVNEQIEKTLESFAKLAPEAVVATKKLLLDLDEMPSSKVREHTSQVIAEKRASSEGQEGLQAFFEKRTPNWVLDSVKNEEEKTESEKES